MNIQQELKNFLSYYIKENTTAYSDVNTHWDGSEFSDVVVQRAFSVWIARASYAN